MQQSNQNQFWEGLGHHLGGVWVRLGLPLGAFGRLLAVFWAFKIELLSSIGPKWAPRGLLDGFWVLRASILDGLGTSRTAFLWLSGSLLPCFLLRLAFRHIMLKKMQCTRFAIYFGFSFLPCSAAVRALCAYGIGAKLASNRIFEVTRSSFFIFLS